MILKTITLKNFKAYEELKFSCNKSFNIMVGANNIGKSTIFDALVLWNLAYAKLIKKDKKGFFKKTSYNNMKINFTQFSIFRLVNTSDLFNNSDEEAVIGLIIEDSDENEYNLEITLNKPDLENSYIRFTNNYEEFKRFSTYCNSQKIKLPEAIKIKITKPISSLMKEEPFCNRAQIKNKTYLGFSNEVLRNKILTVIENKKFDYLQEKLKNILGKSYTLRYKNDNREDKEFIDMTIQEDSKKEVNLLLVGSGILHILEIFSTIKNQQSSNTGVQLLLLDEPDAHIHADIQVKLIDELKLEDNLQTFMITHNDRLIDKALSGELFYINQNTMTSHILESLPVEEYELVSQELFTLVDKDKPIIVTEGKTDWKHFKRALEYFKDNGEFSDLDIEFLEYEESDLQMSESQLDKLLIELSKVSRQNKVIGIFDCDTSIGKKYENSNNQQLSDYIFGIAIPTPSFRSYHDGICTEFLYRDEDLKRANTYGRRIFLSEEFSDKGRLLSDKKIGLENAQKIKNKTSRNKSIIVDSGVLDIDENSLALSKNDFSKHILNKDLPFDTVDFSGFRALFDKIQLIVV